DVEGRHQEGVIEAVTEGTEKWLQNWEQFTAEQNATYINGKIDSVFISGNQICYLLQGNSNAVCIPAPSNVNVLVLRDDDGNQFTIQLMPPPPVITGPTNYLHYSSDSLQVDDNHLVTFSESPQQNFGFDKKEYSAFTSNYEVIKLKSGKNYFVSNKSSCPEKSDEVLAQVQVTAFDPSRLSFQTLNGTVLNATPEGSSTLLKISGITHSAQCVYAVYKGKRIGKLNIVPLKTISKKVTIIPVNGSVINITAEQLNSIFKQAGVTWSLSSTPGFTFNFGVNGLDAPDGPLLSKYSPEMRALRDAYKKYDSLYDQEAYHVFIVPGFSDANMNGYMVRGRALGFVKENSPPKVFAHELAHGAFGLEHTFPRVEKSSSNNLLDYGAGTQMVREQWQMIQSGNFPLNWFDEEEDAQFLFVNNTAVGVYYWISKIKIAYKNSAQLTIPEKIDLIGRATNCYLGGLQYDSICVYLKYGYTPTQLDVKNNITIGAPLVGNSSYAAVCVGGDKIVIRVPTRRLQAMKEYLEYNTFKNLLLFVNGYRPILNQNGDPLSGSEYEDSNNQIEFGDSRSYWAGIDAQFMNRIGTKNVLYADGHHSVKTSNHGSVISFLNGYIAADLAKTLCADYPADPRCTYGSASFGLHTTPNVSGFNYRKMKGREAGLDLLRKIQSGYVLFNRNTDTLDVVAHSMGYAYAVGLLETIRNANIRFGRFYILAPENACSGGMDWSAFREVWQYGSDLDQPNPDPAYYQDGIAPQCEVKGISHLPSNVTGGRIFIPKNYKPKGFLDCHTIKNYDWIFSKTSTQPGYVKSR
ncbi:MAG: hypothetical protein K0S12_1557, partial [Bacteroidetes bacterium]|nr:hypothetical protein [Bacteroidota bacterium]